jgi:hypothetical protein
MNLRPRISFERDKGKSFYVLQVSGRRKWNSVGLAAGKQTLIQTKNDALPLKKNIARQLG